MFALLQSLALAARYYLQIKATTADYDLTLRIENDIREIETSISALRARGDDASERLADELRNRLARAQGIAATVSASRLALGSRAGSGDEGRPLPPANG